MIVTGVILQVFSADTILQPIRMIKVPLYRFSDPLLKTMFRIPTKLFLDARRVDRVTPIMPRSIWYESYQCLARAATEKIVKRPTK